MFEVLKQAAIVMKSQGGGGQEHAKRPQTGKGYALVTLCFGPSLTD